jgi:3-methyl-2-oxobutanoate hydroxymethyltransferase
MFRREFEMKRKSVTIPDIFLSKHRKRIVMLTAYDYLTAKIIDMSDIDIILVGDSLGMTMLGYPNTMAVNMDEMLHHTRAVSRGVRRAVIVGDMPFGSYQTEDSEAFQNAVRFIKSGAHAVKIEGAKFAGFIQKLVQSGIPVMGHIGLTPQSIHVFGGYKVQGRSELDRQRIIQEAKILEKAGVFSIVIEGVPPLLAKTITESVGVPTIGIGAGPHCDGQVLVITD